MVKRIIKKNTLSGGSRITDDAIKDLKDDYNSLEKYDKKVEKYNEIIDEYIRTNQTDDNLLDEITALHTEISEFFSQFIRSDSNKYNKDEQLIKDVSEWIKKLNEFKRIGSDANAVMTFSNDKLNVKYAKPIKNLTEYKIETNFKNRMLPMIKPFLNQLDLPTQFIDSFEGKELIDKLVDVLQKFINDQLQTNDDFKKLVDKRNILEQYFNKISKKINLSTIATQEEKDMSNFLEEFLKKTDSLEVLLRDYNNLSQSEFENLRKDYLENKEPIIRENLADLSKEELSKAVLHKKDKEVIRRQPDELLSESSKLSLVANVTEKERFVDRVIQEMKRLGLLKDIEEEKQTKINLMSQDIPTLLETTKYFTKDFEKVFTGKEREIGFEKAKESLRVSEFTPSAKSELLSRSALKQVKQDYEEEPLAEGIKTMKKNAIKEQATISFKKPKTQLVKNPIEKLLLLKYAKIYTDDEHSNMSNAMVDRKQDVFDKAKKITEGGSKKYPWDIEEVKAITMNKPSKKAIMLKTLVGATTDPSWSPALVRARTDETTNSKSVYQFYNSGSSQYDKGRKELGDKLSSTEYNYKQSIPKIYKPYSEEFSNVNNTVGLNRSNGEANYITRLRSRYASPRKDI